MLRIRCGRREGGGRIDAGTSAGALQAVRTAMVAIAGGIGKDIFGLVGLSFVRHPVSGQLLSFSACDAKDDDRPPHDLHKAINGPRRIQSQPFIANCAATTMGVRYLLGGASIGSTHG